MTIENTMVDGTNGTDRKAPRERRIAGVRPGFGSVWCPRLSVRSSGMLKHGHHTLGLVDLCFGCRRSLPWSAAVLCRFAGARTALSAWTSAKPIGYERSAPERVILSRCCTWLQLVAPGCSYQEKIGTGRLKTEVFIKHQIPTSKHQRMFKCQSSNDLLANLRISLGAWELVLEWSLDVGVSCFVAFRAILAHFCSISVPQGSQALHLVAPRCTYDTLKHAKTRYF